jgi:predicted Mrr-cat superfamily restriction endonuclease
MSVWLVRGGRDGQLAELSIKLKIIAVHFHEAITDLTFVESRHDLKLLMKQNDPVAKDQSIAVRASELWSFAKLIVPNDIIAMPLKRPSVFFGIVVGEYEYDSNLTASPHVRRMKSVKNAAKSNLPEDVTRRPRSPKILEKIDCDENLLRTSVGF